MSHDEDDGGLPIGWMIALLMLAIAALGWGYAANLYSIAEETGFAPGRIGTIRGRARSAFLANALDQLGNAPAVVGYTFRHHLWLVGVVGLLEVGALFGGWKLKQIERHMAQPAWKRRRNK